MEHTLPLVVGLTLWYLVMTIEYKFNGGLRGWDGAFVCWYQDLRCNLPWSGWLYRLKLSQNDIEWAKQFPGPIHFLIMHLSLPFGPVLYSLYG